MAAIPTRLILEIVAALGLVAALAGWWHEHNSHEQLIGSTKCVETYTETKGEATAKTDAVNAEHAKVISTVVQTYDQKIADLNSANADLAQRLHDTATANDRRALPSVAGTAGSIRPAAVDAGPSERDRREALDLEACAANTIELSAMREAWADLAEGRR